jgi:hypothetical protein
MIIDKKIVYARKKEEFEPLIPTIPEGLNPVVFIEDTREMWTCGTYFSIGYPSIEVSEVSGSVKVQIGNSFFLLTPTGDSISLRKGDGNRIIISSNALNRVDTEPPLKWDASNRKLLHMESGVASGSYGQSTNLGNASVFVVPNFIVDATGHITFAENHNIEIRDYVEQVAPSNQMAERNILLSYNEANNNMDTSQVRKANGLTFNDATQRITVAGGMVSDGAVTVNHGDVSVLDGYIIGKLKGDVEGQATPKIHLSLKPEYGGASTKLYGHVKLQDILSRKPDPSSDNENINDTNVVAAIAASPLMVWNAIETAKSYADSILGSNNSMLFKGALEAGISSPGTYTPMADVGNTYVVTFGNGAYRDSVGYINGVSVEVGDLLICKEATAASDGTNWEEVSKKWTYVQTNTTGVVSGPSSATIGQLAVFDSITGKLIKGLPNGSVGQMLVIGESGIPAWANKPDRLNYALSFQVKGVEFTSFDGYEAKKVNFIAGDNMFITSDNQGNLTLAADPGSDTANTAGATDLINTKLFLIGAESQTESPQTYSNRYVYVGADNCLYSDGKKVSTTDHTHPIYVTLDTEQTINGSKTFTTPIISTVASGTAPFRVASNTLVTNLNADRLDNLHENSFLRYRDTVTTQVNTLWAQIGIRQYNKALPDGLEESNTYNYGSVISLPGNDSRLDIWYNHHSSDAEYKSNGIQYRTGWRDGKMPWRTLLDTVNYPSYADSHYVTIATDQAVTGTKTFSKYIKFSNSWEAAGLMGSGDISLGASNRNLVYLNTTEFRPHGAETNKIALGNDSGYWKSVTSGQFISKVGSGTAPLVVASNTLVSNLNADLLDGVHLAGFSGREGVMRSWLRGKYTTVNQYFGNGNVVTLDPKPTDDSTLSANTTIFSLGDTPTRNTQLAFYYDSDTIKYRRHDDSRWNSWVTLLHSGNYAGFLDSRYINVSGDTMTGTLGMGANTIYWRESGFGDKFGLTPYFSGTDDSNYLAFMSSVGAAGTDPTMTAKMVLTGLGNVGIGTTTPTQKLHVIGGGLFTALLTTTGITNNGTLTQNGDIIINQASSTGTRQVRFQGGDNDYGRVAYGGTASNAGWMEIASCNDGNEPIYARQYTGVFTTVKRTATLLDADGNTVFPGTVTAPTFTGALNGTAEWSKRLATNSQLTFGLNGLTYFNADLGAGTAANQNVGPTAQWWHILRMNHGNGSGYFADIAVPLNTSDGIYWRRIQGGTNYGWYRVLDTNNYAGIIDGRYVNVTGDTMTGALSVATHLEVRAANTTTNAMLILHNPNRSWGNITFRDNMFYFVDGNSSTGTTYRPIKANYYIASATTLCTNLNADLLDGYHAFGTSNALIKYGCTVSGTKPAWCRIATYSIRNTETMTDVCFVLHSAFSDLFGLLVVKTRGTAVVEGLLIASYNINRSNIRIYHDAEKKNIELYCYGGSNYSIIQANLLYSHDRGGGYNTAITLYRGDTKAPSWSTYVNPVFVPLQNSSEVAKKLQTPRTLWGQSFDGTANVSGNMTGVGSINMSGQLTSTVASGVAPFIVASNTVVGNLNADLLDGLHENSFLRYRDTYGIDGYNTLWSQIGIRQYNNAKPDGMANPIYNYGAVISLPGANTRLDIWYNHTSSASDSSTNGIQYRSGWGTDKKPWRMLLDSVNAKHYNVGSATKLRTARQINGTNFDGTANIVTSYWGTARNFTIGNTTRSVNGSGNVSWSFADIGGAPASHSHNYINSRGNLNPQTGRTQNLGDVYSYNTASGTSNGAPTTYTSVIGFGRSTGGTVEIAGGWTAGMGLWYRALRNTTDNWYGWIKVWDTRNFDPNSKANSNHNHDGSYITKGGSNNNVVLGAGGYRALSDFTLNSNWAASKDVSGYVKFPNGFIIQWGEAYVGANSTGYKSFPIAFPTACISVQVTHKTTATNWDKVCVAGNYTRTSCTIANCETVNSMINWMALGY